MNPTCFLSSFFDLVRIASPSRHEAVMAACCRGDLESLGGSVHFDNSAEKMDSDAGNGLRRRFLCSGGGSYINKYASHGVWVITLGAGMTSFHTINP